MTTREKLKVAFKMGFNAGNGVDSGCHAEDWMDATLDALDAGEEDTPVELMPYVEYKTEGDNGRGVVSAAAVWVKVSVAGEFLGNWMVIDYATEALSAEQKVRELKRKLGISW